MICELLIKILIEVLGFDARKNFTSAVSSTSDMKIPIS